MRVFVTGATGWVGSAVVSDLIAAGHQVLGLARSQEKAEALAATGAEVLLGSLQDLAVLKEGAARSDGVIHTAFNHDFSKFAENCADDQRAIEALGAALEGTNRPLLVTSGTALLAPGQMATEAHAADFDPSWPRASELAAEALRARGIRAGVVRLPPSVHGHGDHGFLATLIGIAREKGISAYIGEGMNRWSAVHRLDTARVFRLAIEHGAEGGPFHAVGEDSVVFRDIAEVIGRRLDLPVVSLSPEDAAAHFGWFRFASLDVPASSDRTQARLGWKPEQDGLLADLDHPAYFGR